MHTKQMLKLMTLCFGAAILLPGCFLKKEPGTQRVVLKKGWQVGTDQDGWVAVAPSEAKAAKDEAKKVSYHILATHNVVPAKLDGCYALSPALFDKLTGIKLAEQKTPESELWPMKDGRSVPKEKDGWIGVALAYPRVEGGKLATLGADELIPKEMDGWAAIDRETMAQLSAQAEMGKVTVPPKKEEPKK